MPGSRTLGWKFTSRYRKFLTYVQKSPKFASCTIIVAWLPSTQER
jgi:hypothetical protein